MARFGEILREQRDRKGISLEQAAEDTRIREKFLAALETGDHRALPGAVYTKGFLRSYADYLDLDGTELVALYTAERVTTPEAPRTFEPMRPVMRSGVFISPTILVPIVVLAAVVLFVGYLSYQFASFATPPRIEVLEPASSDTLARESEYVVRGRTVPDGRVTIRVFPGPTTLADIRPASDGSFSATIELRPGINHVEIRVLDAAGKASEVARTIRYEIVAERSPGPEAPAVVVEQPAQGATYTNAGVPVSGRVERGVVSLEVNGAPITIGTDGRFADAFDYPAGTHALRFVARTAAGAESSETRQVSVSFTQAVVTVRVDGGDAWLLARVDGAQAEGTGRIFESGAVETFSGQRVTIRTGNAAATHVVYNGEPLGALGGSGEVVERTFTFQ
ncbi:MAG: helix-turn-helix domain-containing protein [Candidatus Limnocylindria bacterium]